MQSLPLARIKKIMKSEEFILQELEKEKLQQEGQGADESKSSVKFMISAEAPLLMCKACELLIKEVSARSWQHTERNRRRTLQRQDVHAAVGESEVFDFLIDIVPRVAGARAPVPPSLPEPSSLAQMTAVAAPINAQGASDFGQQAQDPMQGGQFPGNFFYPTMPGQLEATDTTQSLGVGMIGHPGHQMQQPQQQQQQQHQQQHQAPQWTDPPV